MVSFRDTVHLDTICLGVVAASRDEALAQAVDLLAACGRIKNPASLLSYLIEREKISSTGLGSGVAVPHVLLDGQTGPVCAVLRLEKPVDFGSPDGEGVDLLFVLVGKRGETGAHLKILSELAKILQEEENRKKMREARTPEALSSLLLS